MINELVGRKLPAVITLITLYQPITHHTSDVSQPEPEWKGPLVIGPDEDSEGSHTFCSIKNNVLAGLSRVFGARELCKELSVCVFTGLCSKSIYKSDYPHQLNKNRLFQSATVQFTVKTFYR